MPHSHIRPQSDDEQVIKKLRPNLKEIVSFTQK